MTPTDSVQGSPLAPGEPTTLPSAEIGAGQPAGKGPVQDTVRTGGAAAPAEELKERSVRSNSEACVGGVSKAAWQAPKGSRAASERGPQRS